ncbi:MAG: hypothetical protein LBB84_11670, partial [Tannerellaceae bacterium]|nr:hypothetical protein [Tannerellaceae bacterium]
MKKNLFLISGLLLVSALANATSDPDGVDSLIHLKGIVVSANKVQVNRSSVPLSISVIERSRSEEHTSE